MYVKKREWNRGQQVWVWVSEVITGDPGQPRQGGGIREESGFELVIETWAESSMNRDYLKPLAWMRSTTE